MQCSKFFTPLIYLSGICLSGLWLNAYAKPTPAALNDIQLIKNMQQTLLVKQSGTINSIAQFYNQNFYINNQAYSRTQILQDLQQRYANNRQTKIIYHYFTVSGNNVSWYENISTTDRQGLKKQRDILELALLEHGKISRLFAAGS